MPDSIGTTETMQSEAWPWKGVRYTWQARYGSSRSRCEGSISPRLTLQLPFPQVSESMGKTSLHGWHRHVSFVMLAFAMTAVIRHRANRSPPKKRDGGV
jgi:hypothetical protein